MFQSSIATCGQWLLCSLRYGPFLSSQKALWDRAGFEVLGLWEGMRMFWPFQDQISSRPGCYLPSPSRRLVRSSMSSRAVHSNSRVAGLCTQTARLCVLRELSIPASRPLACSCSRSIPPDPGKPAAEKKLFHQL